jgi:nucleoside-diphosphate-sugar epimerase
VFGDGTYAVQPVHVEEVARAFVQALALDTEGVPRSYCAAGREEVPFNDALDRIAQGMGRQPKRKAHLPLGLSRLLVDTVGAAGLLPISPAQFRMLIEGNTCDPSAFLADFGIEPRPFTPDNLSYLRS